MTGNSPTKRVAAFWDAKASVHDQIWGNGIHSPSEIRCWTDFLIEQLGVAPRTRALDAGAGTGVLSGILSAIGYRTTALDLSQGMCARALLRSVTSHSAFDVVSGNMAVLPFPDGIFDAVIVRHAMGGIPDQIAALTEFRRVLTPSGVFLLIELEPSRRDWWSRLLMLTARLLLAAHRDSHLFRGDEHYSDVISEFRLPGRTTRGALIEGLQRAGFVVLRTDSLAAVVAAECRSAPLYHKVLARVTPRFALSCVPGACDPQA